jgi:hypothetical protein
MDHKPHEVLPCPEHTKHFMLLLVKAIFLTVGLQTGTCIVVTDVYVYVFIYDRLCGLVVSVEDYKHRGSELGAIYYIF